VRRFPAPYRTEMQKTDTNGARVTLQQAGSLCGPIETRMTLGGGGKL